jgi:hypothetical protein
LKNRQGKHVANISDSRIGSAKYFRNQSPRVS